MSIRIIVDSSADMEEDHARAHDITIIPMTIAFGSEQYAEGVDLFARGILRAPRGNRRSALHEPDPPYGAPRPLPRGRRRRRRGRSHAFQPHLRHLPERRLPRRRSRSRYSWSTARTPPSASASWSSAPGPCATRARRRHRLLPQPGEEGHPTRGLGHAGVPAAAAAFPERRPSWAACSPSSPWWASSMATKSWARPADRSSRRTWCSRRRRGRRHRLHAAHLGGLLGPA